MPHEAVEVRGIGLLPEVHFHGPPILLVKPGLELRLQSHQDEVANQISLTQFAPRGIEALEYELWVVLIAAERDVDDYQLGQALADRYQIILRFSHPLFEKLEVGLHPDRGLLRLGLL